MSSNTIEQPKKSTKRRLFESKDDEEVVKSEIPTSSSSGTPSKRTRLEQTTLSSGSLAPKELHKAAVVTPEQPTDQIIDLSSDDEDTEEPKVAKAPRSLTFREPYVPEYIHKNLDYQREGVATISSKLAQTYKLVCQHYIIPDDFEENRRFGPLSGTCYEERVVGAYVRGQLNPRHSEKGATKVEICSHCAVEGHLRKECPDLV